MVPTKAIPLAAPDIGDEERRLVDEVLRSRYLASGRYLDDFENAMAERFGARFAVGVSSGTAALHLAMIAAGVRDGDLVITSPFSFIASANAILYERGIPIFVDIDPVTLTIDPARTLQAIDDITRHRPGWRHLLPRTCNPTTSELRAVLPVHIFGRLAEMEEIVDASHAANIPVIEDACEAIGAQADGVYAGRWGDAATFGFYPNKQITAGEGGMLLTDNEQWARLFRSLRNQGRSDDAQWLRHDHLGFNYRLDEMSAAVALAQLRRLDELLKARDAVARRYTDLLALVDGVTPLAPPRPGSTMSWFLYPIRVSEEIDRDRLMARLIERGVMTRPYFWPIHLQPLYRERFGFAPGDFPVAERAGHTLMSLPLWPNLPESDIDYVCEVVAEEVEAVRETAAV
jgi:perosamine synthetase